jgi:hypothetical protein
MSFENIFTEGVLVHLHIRKWSGTVGLNPQDLGLDPKSISEDFFLGKKYIIPKEEVNKIRAAELAARRALEYRSFQFPTGNTRFVPKGVLGELQEDLEQCRDRFWELQEDLASRFSQLLQSSGAKFREAVETGWENTQKTVPREEYVNLCMQQARAAIPHSLQELKEKYHFSYSVFTVTIPNGSGVEVESVNLEMMQQYRETAGAQLDEFLNEVVGDLRKQTYKVCSNVAGLISEGKAITEVSLNTLREFIDKFRKLNFTRDETIGNQLEALKADYLDTYGAKDIRTAEEVREEFQMALSAVVEKAVETNDISNITGKVKRQLELD